jgi:glycosyl transferase family 87
VWLPSRLVLNGVNPYSPSREQVDAALGEYASAFTGSGAFNSGSSYHFIYPLWVALLMAPFGAAPLVGATAVWRAANILLLVWGVAAVLRSSSRIYRSMRPAAIAAMAVAALLCLIYRPSMLLTVYHGQFAIIEFGLLAAIWGWLMSSGSSRRSRVAGRELAQEESGSGLEARGSGLVLGDALTGVALAVLATKPQAVGLAVLLIAVWAVSRRRWTIPVAACAATAILLLVPNLFYPWSLGDWLGIVFGGQATSQVSVSASVWGVSYQWLGSSPVWMPVAVLGSLAGLLVLVPVWRRDLRNKVSYVPEGLLLTLCINSVISPYMLGYEHVVLLFPALVFLAWAGLPSSVESPESKVQSQDEGEKTLDFGLWTLDSAQRRLWRLAIFVWIGLLPFIVVTVQAVLDREYPAILQSASLLAFAGLAWAMNGTKNGTKYAMRNT